MRNYRLYRQTKCRPSYNGWAKKRKLQELKQGDLVAVMSAGAYGFAMSSNYNSRRRVAEVIVRGKEVYVTRKRESYEDLIRGESIPRM